MKIELFTDFYFHIGKSHLNTGKPCQDYALSGIYNNTAYAVITDGCSSGRCTDIGARVLALATVSAIKEHWDTHKLIDYFASQKINLHRRVITANAQKTLGLQEKDMLATCSYIYLSPENGFIHIHGDGAIALKYKNGKVEMIRWDWPNNMPFYPAYLENNLLDNFISIHGGNLNTPCLKETECLQEYDEGFVKNEKVRFFSLIDGIQGIKIPISKILIDQLEFIAIFSDGITQIDGINWKEAIIKSLSFRSTAGEFTKRRMIKFIKKIEQEQKSRGLLDDLSCAVIRIESKDVYYED